MLLKLKVQNIISKLHYTSIVMLFIISFTFMWQHFNVVAANDIIDILYC